MRVTRECKLAKFSPLRRRWRIIKHFGPAKRKDITYYICGVCNAKKRKMRQSISLWNWRRGFVNGHRYLCVKKRGEGRQKAQDEQCSSNALSRVGASEGERRPAGGMSRRRGPARRQRHLPIWDRPVLCALLRFYPGIPGIYDPTRDPCRASRLTTLNLGRASSR